MEDASPSDFSFAFCSPQFSDCTLCLHTERGTAFTERGLGDSELGTGWCSLLVWSGAPSLKASDRALEEPFNLWRSS